MMKISYLIGSICVTLLGFVSVSFALTGYSYGGNNYCGDSISRHGEECDDGNAINGDGCNRNCFLEPGFFIGTGGEILRDQDIIDGENNEEDGLGIEWLIFNAGDDVAEDSAPQSNILSLIRKRNIRNIIAGQINAERNKDVDQEKTLTYPTRLEETGAGVHDIFYLFLSLFGMIGLGFTLFMGKVRSK